MRLKINEKLAEAAVLGGAFFGGGGGGDLEYGLRHAKLAIELGDVIIVDIDNVPRDSLIVTASMVGAPAAKEKYLTPSHMIKSTELLIEIEKMEIGGIISSENGGYSTINGWIQSAILGIPIIDAPADGRAHPTGIMGAMGLHKLPEYISIQAAVGGNKGSGRYIELFVKGNLERTSRMVREAAVQAGGLVAVTRNPISPEYVKENAAVGGITQAIEVGKIIQAYKNDVEGMIDKVLKYLGGKFIDYGIVKDRTLETRGGFDIGSILIEGDIGDMYEITFWNEYMTLESDKRRLGTFPDLIVTINVKNSLPLSSAEIRKGQEVAILVVPKEKLLLGAGVKDPDVLKQVEMTIGKKMVG